MNKKRIFFLFFLCLVLFLSFRVGVHAENSKFFTISANPAENSNTSVNFVWHTEKGVTGTYVLYTKETDTTWANATRINATSTLNSAFAGKNAKYGTTSDDLKVPYEFTKNEATAVGLEPGTKYMYKITDGSVSSDVRHFKTGDQEFNFVWTSDFHAYYADARRLNKATVAINKCINLANNNVDFILSTGDIVAHGGTYQWWKQVSEASWMKNYLFATTLGNHDWMTNVGTNYSDGASYKFMDACFNNPRNGFSGQENICYYFYYGDALFICVNTEVETANYLGMTSSQFVKAQQDWVESVLQTNSAQYIFLFQHYQAFSTSGAYQSSGYTRWHDICDRYDIDVFLSGNSHVYMRSLPIYEGAVSTDPSHGTVYLVAPSSDGERGVSYTPHTNNTDKIVKSWSDTKAQAASLVKVTKEGITFQLVNYDGTILDSAEILPKRLPSSTEPVDLSGFDKTQFENSFRVNVNQNNITNPVVNFSADASSVLRTIKVTNASTDDIYYEGMILKNATSCLLNMVEKGNLTINIELLYVDLTTKVLTFNINNTYDWGSISNYRIEEEGEKFILKWDENINFDRIQSIDILVDNIRYDAIYDDITESILPSRDGEYHVKLVVKDKDGDIVYTSNELQYEVVSQYTVTFVDHNGKELKTEVVAKGADATPPEYNNRNGYNLVGWDTDYHNVHSNLTVKAIVEEKERNVQFGCMGGAYFVMLSSMMMSVVMLFIFKRKK